MTHSLWNSRCATLALLMLAAVPSLANAGFISGAGGSQAIHYPGLGGFNGNSPTFLPSPHHGRVTNPPASVFSHRMEGDGGPIENMSSAWVGTSHDYYPLGGAGVQLASGTGINQSSPLDLPDETYADLFIQNLGAIFYTDDEGFGNGLTYGYYNIPLYGYVSAGGYVEFRMDLMISVLGDFGAIDTEVFHVHYVRNTPGHFGVTLFDQRPMAGVPAFGGVSIQSNIHFIAKNDGGPSNIFGLLMTSGSGSSPVTPSPTPTPLPEPSTSVLLGVAFLATAVRRWRHTMIGNL